MTNNNSGSTTNERLRALLTHMQEEADGFDRRSSEYRRRGDEVHDRIAKAVPTGEMLEQRGRFFAYSKAYNEMAIAVRLLMAQARGVVR